MAYKKNITALQIAIVIFTLSFSSWVYLNIAYADPVQNPPGSLLQPQDVTSLHIQNGTIVNNDISPTAEISAKKIVPRGIAGTVLLTDGTNISTTSEVKIDESGNNSYFFGHRLHATSTNFNSWNQNWPSSDGQSGQYLKTDGAGTFSFGSPGASYATTTGAQATTTINWGTATHWKIHLTQATEFLFRGGATGTPYTLVLEQPATTTVSVKWGDGIQFDGFNYPVLSTYKGTQNVFRFSYDGSTYSFSTSTQATSAAFHDNLKNEILQSDGKCGTTNTGTREGTELAQSFYLTNALYVKSIAVGLIKEGTPADNVILSIQTDNAGEPSGTIVASTTMAGASVSGSNTYEKLNFFVPTLLNATTTYWMVCDRDGADSTLHNYQFDTINNNGDNGRGLAKYKKSGTWTADGADISFSLFGDFTR